MCANLLRDVRSAYSYGIAGYDQWGCDISTALKIPVHQYDCFDTTRPACPGGTALFHPECVGDAAKTEQGHMFDTLTNHVAGNGDTSKQIVLKIDVEGAEWNTLLSAPDEMLERIDQMAVEFHWLQDGSTGWLHDEKYLSVVKRLKEFFEIAHVHFNNASCIERSGAVPHVGVRGAPGEQAPGRCRPVAQRRRTAPARRAEQPHVSGLPAKRSLESDTRRAVQLGIGSGGCTIPVARQLPCGTGRKKRRWPRERLPGATSWRRAVLINSDSIQPMARYAGAALEGFA